jgi:hypothetical protein
MRSQSPRAAQPMSLNPGCLSHLMAAIMHSPIRVQDEEVPPEGIDEVVAESQPISDRKLIVDEAEGRKSSVMD